MGRVLLAGLSDASLEDHLAHVTLAPSQHGPSSPPTDCARKWPRLGADGYCIVDQELEEGLRSLAAPIRDHIGAVIAAVNISTQAARYSAAAVRKDLLPQLLATAEAIHPDLTHVQTQAWLSVHRVSCERCEPRAIRWTTAIGIKNCGFRLHRRPRPLSEREN
ncbi:hypothetical protein IU483_25215 [Streptomyces gardneri]|nr:hypothetical protein [Streptomyces gardneri]